MIHDSFSPDLQPNSFGRLERRLRVRSLHRVHRSLYLAAVALPLVLPQLHAQSTGQLTGSIVTQAGVPIPRAFVIATRSDSGRTPSENTRSAADGSFAFTNLAVGTYRICVQVLGSSFLDPCLWPGKPPAVTITAGQIAAIGKIQLSSAVTLHVNLIDDNGLLQSNAVTAKTPGANILIGVRTGTGAFYPVRLRSKQAGGVWNHEIVVPFDTLLNLEVSSSKFTLSDDKGNALNALAGVKVPVTVAAATSLSPIVFHVTGFKN